MDTAGFLKALYGDIPTGFVEVRLIHRGHTSTAGETIHRTEKRFRPLPLGEIQQAGIEALRRRNADGWNVYFQVAVENHAHPGTHNKQDVLCITALWYDIDAPDADTEQRLLSHAFAPDILIKSGKGYHGYFLLPEPVMLSAQTLPRIERTLDGMALAFNGDRKCKNVNRVLRLPGFYNMKPDYVTPPLCEVVEAYPNSGLKQFRVYENEFAPLGAVPAPTVKRDIPREAVDSTLPARVQTYLNTPTPAGRRNQELFIAACYYRDAGRTQGDAESALGAKAASDGLPQSEIQQTISSAYRRATNYRLASHLQAVAAVEDTRAK